MSSRWGTASTATAAWRTGRSRTAGRQPGARGLIRLERLDDGVGMCAMLTYLTAVEVDEPKCSDEAFCNANGTATSQATKADNVGDGDDDWQSNPGGAVAWGCACECGGGHAGRQCEWECVGDDDCADAKGDTGAPARSAPATASVPRSPRCPTAAGSITARVAMAMTTCRGGSAQAWARPARAFSAARMQPT